MNTSASAVVNIYTLNLQIKDVCGPLVKGWNRKNAAWTWKKRFTFLKDWWRREVFLVKVCLSVSHDLCHSSASLIWFTVILNIYSGCLKSLEFQHNMQHLYQSNTIKNGCSTYGYEEITFHVSISAFTVCPLFRGEACQDFQVLIFEKPEMNDAFVVLQGVYCHL